MLLWPMMLHNHTRFGNKMSVVQKILSGQTFTNILSPSCDLDLESSNPIFPQDTLAYDAVLSNQVWLQTDQQFIKHKRNGHILIT